MTAPYFDGTQECRQHPDLYFPARAESTLYLGLARAICARCPFRDPCAEFAITQRSVGVRWLEGIWSGTTERQRQRIREKRGVA